MADNQYKLKEKSEIELHEWIAGHKPDSDQYVAGIKELMRRNDVPVRNREWIAIGIAILSITVAIVIIVATYE